MAKGKYFDDFQVNDEFISARRTITETDIVLFAGLSGDYNPLHTDETYARNTLFKTRIAHGMLLGGLISAVLGNRLPGPGTVYIRQEMDFLAPVRIGDTVTASVEVVEVLKETKRVRVRTRCVDQRGVTVLDGEALVSPPKKPKA